ncbi:MAG: cob(I)yrinic acid a,c-diamide adenosyltransferase [Phycisphaerales bacterium]|nr:cob(I)yrinic acid a,c-diamide adenosyltransferase [Phycisphaerales bacterium]
MVKLNKIYTRTGDDGTTGLGDGARVAKADARVEAYGTTDEANAAVGLAVIACRAAGGPAATLAPILETMQHDLFDCGADLCTPIKDDGKESQRLRIIPDQIERLEALIDRYNEDLDPLTSFVLPGGTPPAAALHLARTIVRRAERLASIVLETQPEETNPLVVRYLNRLSDLLFVLGRVANPQGDVLWKPGANRETH